MIYKTHTAAAAKLDTDALWIEFIDSLIEHDRWVAWCKAVRHKPTTRERRSRASWLAALRVRSITLDPENDMGIR